MEKDVYTLSNILDGHINYNNITIEILSFQNNYRFRYGSLLYFNICYTKEHISLGVRLFYSFIELSSTIRYKGSYIRFKFGRRIFVSFKRVKATKP